MKMVNEFVIVNKNGKFDSNDVAKCMSLSQLDVYEKQVDNDILSIGVRLMTLSFEKNVSEKQIHDLKVVKRLQGHLKMQITKRRSFLKKIKPLSEYILDVVKQKITSDEWQYLVLEAKKIKEHEDSSSEREEDFQS